MAVLTVSASVADQSSPPQTLAFFLDLYMIALGAGGAVCLLLWIPIVRTCQVIVAAFRKWRVHLPVDESLSYEVPGKDSAIEGSRKLDHTNDLRKQIYYGVNFCLSLLAFKTASTCI